MELLSEEFRSQHGIDDYGYDASGAGAAILPPRKKKGKVGGSTSGTGPKMVPVKISTRVERRKAKSKARKLVSIVTEKEKKDRRVELYASLASSSLTRDEHALLSGSGTLGGALSAKESLKMQLRRQRAGLESLPGDGSTKSSTLQRSREVGGEMGEEGEGEGGSEGEEVGAKEVASRKRPRSVEVVQPTASKKEVVVEEVEEEEEEDMDGEGELEEEEEEEEENGEDLEDSEGDEGSDEEDGEEEEEGSEESAKPAPPPSSFSFKVSLSQLGSSKAVTSKQAPVVVAQQPSTTTDLASESLGRRFLAGKLEQRAIDGEAQEGGVGQQQQQQQQGGEEAQMSSLFSVPLNGGKRFDEDTRKLLELREKNMLERSGGGGGEGGDHHHTRGTSSGDMHSRREMPGNSAYLATDAWSEDGKSEQGEDEEEGEEEEEEGGGKRGKGKREVGRKEEIEAEEREKRGGGGPPSLPLSSYSAYAPKHSVTKRGVKEGEARMELPVVRMEQEIMEAALENDVVIIAGETGSGKTTQVPQFFLEAGYGLPPSLVTAYVPQSASATPTTTTPLSKYRPNALYSGIPGMIAVTQPRRVAAVAMATRVGSELGSPVRSGGGGKSMVGYAVRFDSSTVGSGTRIKFLTDGILLREISTDLLLRQYSCIIVDEAHERGVNTDLLLGLLSRALPLRNAMARSQAEDLRKRMEGDPTLPLPLPGTPGAPLTPLKLVIMSATLRLEDFSGASARAILFPTLHRPPPVLTVSSRQFPVTVHFSKTTELVDYTGTAVAKVCRMHSKLPEGGILVFLTGQAEVEEAVASLKERLGRSAVKKATKAAAAAVAAAAEASAAAAAAVAGGGEGEGEGEGKAAAAAATATTQLSSPPPEKYTPVTILPLFAMLPREDQDKVFIPPPNGHRLIVVATNVAETSITIPGIRYVVDAGRVKRKVYHAASGTSRMEVGWVSQASANQRAGRAGRVGPGHAYRLYSSAVFSDKCPGHEEPEVCSTPLPSLVLTLKSMGIDCVSTFPFPTPPPPNALLAAVRSLTNLGALVPTLKPQPASHTGSSTTIGRGGSTNPSPLLLGSHIPTLQAIGKEELTPLGALLARLPLYPPLAKAMVLAWQAQCSARGSSDGSGGGGDGEEHPAHNLLRHTALAVASMTVENLLWVPSGAPPRRVGGKKRVSVILEKVEGGGGKVEEEDLDEDLDEEGEVDPDLEAELRREGGVGGEEGEEREGMDAALALSWEKAKKDRQAAQAAHALLRHPLSDALTMLSMVGAFSYASASSSPADRKRTERGFCKEHWLRMKAMVEVLALGDQLINTMEVCLGGSGGEGEALIASAGGDESEERGGGDNGGTIKNTPSSGSGSGSGSGGAVKEHPPLPPPSPLTQTLIRQVIASGYIEHIAKRPTPSLSAALCAAARVPIGSGWTPYLPASASVSTGIAAGAAAALASGELNSAQGGKEGESAALEGAARSLGMGGGLEASVAGGGGGGGGEAATLPPCIWVHPHSSVYSSDTSLMPPLIVFTSITFGKAGRAYARCVTAIEESWLPSLAGGTPLLSWSPPLPGSSFYDAPSDAVCASFTPVFGDGAWRLKPVPRPLLSHGGGEGGGSGGGGGGQKDTLDTVVRLFARAVLEGVAVKGLAQWSSHLAAPPSSVTKKSPTKRVLQLVYALMKPEEHARGGKLAHTGPVVCKAHLADVWRVCPGFLAGEVAAWVKEGEMERFSAQWPRLVRDFLKECN